MSVPSPTEPSGILTPAQMAQAAEDAAFTKATGRPLKSFLLGLTGLFEVNRARPSPVLT